MDGESFREKGVRHEEQMVFDPDQRQLGRLWLW